MGISTKMQQAVGIVIVTIFLLALTPTIVNIVQDMNTTGWSFIGYEGAETLLGLIPFVWVASILLGAVASMYYISKR